MSLLLMNHLQTSCLSLTGTYTPVKYEQQVVLLSIRRLHHPERRENRPHHSSHDSQQLEGLQPSVRSSHRLTSAPPHQTNKCYSMLVQCSGWSVWPLPFLWRSLYEVSLCSAWNDSPRLHVRWKRFVGSTAGWEEPAVLSDPSSHLFLGQLGGATAAGGDAQRDTGSDSLPRWRNRKPHNQEVSVSPVAEEAQQRFLRLTSIEETIYIHTWDEKINQTTPGVNYTVTLQQCVRGTTCSVLLHNKEFCWRHIVKRIQPSFSFFLNANSPEIDSTSWFSQLSWHHGSQSHTNNLPSSAVLFPVTAACSSSLAEEPTTMTSSLWHVQTTQENWRWLKSASVHKWE